MCLAVRTDPRTWCCVVPSKDKQHFACLPFVVVVFFYVRARDPCFLSQCAHRFARHATSNVDCKFGRTEWSRSGVRNEFRSKRGSSAEHLPGTCMRSRLKKNQYIWILSVEVPRVDLCSDSTVLDPETKSSQVPPTCLTMVAPGGQYPS